MMPSEALKSTHFPASYPDDYCLPIDLEDRPPRPTVAAKPWRTTAKTVVVGAVGIGTLWAAWRGGMTAASSPQQLDTWVASPPTSYVPQLRCVPQPGRLAACPEPIFPKKKARGGLAMCATVKDENWRDVQEWITHYLRMGAERIYLIDDNSTVPLRNTPLRRTLAEGRIHYEYINVNDDPQYPTRWTQLTAYADCIGRFGPEHKWMAFFDVDEYLTLMGRQPILEFLKNFEEYGALGVCWETFGSSNYLTRPDKPATEAYLKCIPEPAMDKEYVKLIANMHYANTTSPAYSMHEFHYLEDKYAVDERHERIAGGFVPLSHRKQIKLAHYSTRSMEEMAAKIRRAALRGGAKDWNFIKVMDEMSTAWCSEPRDYARWLKSLDRG